MDRLGATRDPESDKRHDYFVGVLKKVYETLDLCMEPAVQKDLNNRFARVTVYGPSEEFENAPNIERPVSAEKPASNDIVTYEAESMDSVMEALLVYILMLHDLGKTRDIITKIWISIPGPASAALATETAFALARNMMEDVLPVFENMAASGRLLQNFV